MNWVPRFLLQMAGSSSSLRLFYNDYDDYQIAGFDPLLAALITANVGKAEVKGSRSLLEVSGI